MEKEGIAAFIDRDGVITALNSYELEEKSGYLTRGKSAHLTKKEDIKIIDSAIEGIKLLNKNGIKTIVVTNQSSIAKGFITEPQLKEINDEIIRQLKQNGAIIDAVYHCPHHPDGTVLKYAIKCECRKPKPGMILKAASEHKINLKKSFVIGDRTSDIKAGALAGCRTIGVKTGYACADNFESITPDIIAENLLDAAKIITNETLKNDAKEDIKIPLVLATGGKGERLYPLTKTIPKPLIKIAGKPILHHLIDWAKKNPVSEIILLNGYMAEKIVDYFGNGDKFGIKITHINEPFPLGTGGALNLAKPLLNKTFAYMNGDTICEVDLEKMLNFHKKNSSDITLFLKESEREDADKIKIDNDNKVIKLISKHEPDKDPKSLLNTGLCIAERKILDLIDKESFNLENYLFPKIIENGLKISGYLSKEVIEDMGTLERLEETEALLSNRNTKVKKVFVTGAGGMIGAHILDFLVEKGHDVLGIDYIPTTDINELNKKAKYVKCDIRNKEELQSLISKFKPDIIIHLAAQSYPVASWENPIYTMEVNILGTINLFESVKELKLDCVILNAGSSAIYGYTEEHEVPIKESKIPKPLHPYGISKIAQELLGYQYYKNFGIKSVTIRIFNTTGPKKVNDVCSDFTRQIVLMEKGLQEKKLRVGNLDKRRAITDVRDLIESLWLAIQKCEGNGESYNVSGEKVYLVRDIIETLRKLTSISFEIVPDAKLIRHSDEPIIYGDSTKFKEKTGWSQKIPIERTLKDMLDYWRKKL